MTGPARTIALIGATSGLGRAAADQLAKQGHNLILVGRDPQRAQRLAGTGYTTAEGKAAGERGATRPFGMMQLILFLG